MTEYAYAQGTTVPVSRTRGEIEEILMRFGADRFMYGWHEQDDTRFEVISFQYEGRQIRFLIKMPSIHDSKFAYTEAKGLKRSREATEKKWREETQRLWRSFFNVIKAKLVAIEDGVSDFSVEFLPFTVLPDGSTVAESLEPRIIAAIAKGAMPVLEILPPADRSLPPPVEQE